MLIFKNILIGITGLFIFIQLFGARKKEDFVILSLFISYLVYLILS